MVDQNLILIGFFTIVVAIWLFMNFGPEIQQINPLDVPSYIPTPDAPILPAPKLPDPPAPSKEYTFRL